MTDKIHLELSYLFSGLSFYTRLPCPAWVKYSPESLNKSRKYLPLIGMIIGAIAAAVFYLSQLVLPESISIALSMMVTVYLTGAFHEDGLADCADGFGGGWDKRQILKIMKDSRVGSYGVVSLVLVLGLKFLVLWELQLIDGELMMFALIAGHSLSRLMASLIMQFYDYVSEDSASKSKTITSLKLSVLEMLWSLVPITVLLVFMAQLHFLVAIASMLLLTWFLARGYQQRIAGYTGDCLGATQQLTELLFYMVLVVRF